MIFSEKNDLTPSGKMRRRDCAALDNRPTLIPSPFKRGVTFLGLENDAPVARVYRGQWKGETSSTYRQKHCASGPFPTPPFRATKPGLVSEDKKPALGNSMTAVGGPILGKMASERKRAASNKLPLITLNQVPALLVAQREWESSRMALGSTPPCEELPMSPLAHSHYYGTKARTAFFDSVKHYERVKRRQGRPYSPSRGGEESPAGDCSFLPPLFGAGGRHHFTAVPDNKGERRQLTSPRSTFLRELIFVDNRKSHLMPRSALVIRNPSDRVPEEEIDLSYQGIGDALGIALAKCLHDLPGLQRLKLRDCQLTDLSLAPLLSAVQRCSSLTSLDLGHNKIDTEASAAIGQLLAMPGCRLLDLSLCKADVDDSECCELVSKLKATNALTSLDLSHNMIGGGETTSSSTTGAVAIASLLSAPDGNLQILDLSWNLIRKASAQRLGEALSGNQRLVELNLAFNACGEEGGLAIGGSLFTNRTLRRLTLSNNSISSRSAFTIAVACRCNKALEELDLRCNPVGH